MLNAYEQMFVISVVNAEKSFIQERIKKISFYEQQMYVYDDAIQIKIRMQFSPFNESVNIVHCRYLLSKQWMMRIMKIIIKNMNKWLLTPLCTFFILNI